MWGPYCVVEVVQVGGRGVGRGEEGCGVLLCSRSRPGRG